MTSKGAYTLKVDEKKMKRMTSKGAYTLKVDEKKMKRMTSNRESARRSRMKKEQHMKDLNEQIFYLTKKRDEMVMNIEGFTKGYTAIETENMILRSQKQELEKRLEYANHVCGWYEGDHDHGLESMSSMGVVQEPWLRPWDPYDSINFMSSANIPILTDY